MNTVVDGDASSIVLLISPWWMILILVAATVLPPKTVQKNHVLVEYYPINVFSKNTKVSEEELLGLALEIEAGIWNAYAEALEKTREQ